MHHHDQHVVHGPKVQQSGANAGFGVPLVSPPADRTVGEGDVLDLAGVRWTVRETPGHSIGHVVFIAVELRPVVVLGGDVLFAGSVGRTDFPDGDSAALVASIREKLFTLPDDTVVLPGHGPASLAWPAAVAPQKRYLETVANDVRTMIKQGRTLSEAMNSAGLSEKDAWLLFKEYHARNISAAFAELEWE